MKCEAEVKELLISNAINIIAEGGFENATTKALTHTEGNLTNLKMNEVYIYRIFGSKEKLFEAVFLRLDSEIARAFKNGIESVSELDGQEKYYEFFLKVWRFILSNEKRCRCYVRYYYSIYFNGDSVLAHKKLMEQIVAQIAPIFKEEADVHSIMHSIFTTFLAFAIRVYNGELEDNEINRPHIFNVLYCMAMTYFKDSVK
jgi:AcrR family transcriptional regulator